MGAGKAAPSSGGGLWEGSGGVPPGAGTAALYRCEARGAFARRCVDPKAENVGTQLRQSFQRGGKVSLVGKIASK